MEAFKIKQTFTVIQNTTHRKTFSFREQSKLETLYGWCTRNDNIMPNCLIYIKKENSLHKLLSPVKAIAPSYTLTSKDIIC